MSLYNDKLINKYVELKKQDLSRGEIEKKLGLTHNQVKYLQELLTSNVIPSPAAAAGATMSSEEFIKMLRTDLLKGATTPIFDKKDLFIERDYTKNKLEESAVLHLTDLHVGKVNEFFDFGTKRSRITYNFDIFKTELKTLRQAVQEIYTLLTSAYHFKELWILLTGDIIENDRIFDGQKFHIDMAAGKQVWEAIGMLGQLIESFKPLFKTIHVVGVVGNHGRFSPSGKEDAPVCNSFDYQIYKTLELVFKDDPQVKVDVPDSPFYVVDIYKWHYLMLHGDNVRGWGSIPFYGLARAGLQYFTSLVPDVVLDLILSGHLHQTLELPLSEKLDWITSASWTPKDAYSFKWYKTFPRTTQRFWGVNPKRPMSWSYKIDLQTGFYQ